jgi:predicted nucleic acid-binding protein
LLKLYLDTSVLLKRYVYEPETETIDIIFDKAEIGELTIVTSLWNIGEALGVLDEKQRRGWLTKVEFEQTLTLFTDELLKLLRIKTLEIIPAHSSIITSTWKLIMNSHIYQADALQITTYNYNKSQALITSDKRLGQTSKETGVKTILIPRDEQELKNLIENKDSQAK